MPDENRQFFEMKLTVGPDDLDEMEHVNNVRYLQWVQDVAKAHWQKIAAPEWHDQYAWVVINHFIEYKRPALLGDPIKIMTHVHENSGVKSQRLVRIVHAGSNELLVQASTWWCLLDAKTKRPKRVPDDIIQAFQ